jgi:hypothetical protein
LAAWNFTLSTCAVLGFFALGEVVAHAQRVDALGLQLGKALVEGGDGRELLECLRLELLLHLRQRQGIILIVVVGRTRHTALGQPVLILVGSRGFLGLVFVLERRPGTLLADLACIFLGALDLLGGWAFRYHRIEIQDLAELHRAFVELGRPVDDGIERDRAFAQALDHSVPASLDPLGDGDLALAAEQLDRAHLAQIHAHGIVGAIDRFFLGNSGGESSGGIVAGYFLFLVLIGLLRLLAVFASFFVLDDVDAHLVQGGHHVFDLLRGHLVLGQRFVELVIGDVAALLGAREDLLDRRVVEIDQRRIATVRLLASFRNHAVLRHATSSIP